MSYYAIILAGGSGVRLWPLSRESLPKQLIPVQKGASLLEAAYARLDGVVPPGHRWVCGSARHEKVVRTRLPELGKYIGEPEGRDTLAAIGLSCALVRAEDPDATVAILTSDHVIEPVEDFRVALRAAFAIAESGAQPIVTFGVRPTFAATAYGYLELGEQLANSEARLDTSTIHELNARRVLRFREKPDRLTAERFLAEGPEH
ncbi:MAG: sugar phosphate nucleotidyltransferase [Rectinema sp.]|nr:sugar phosphate nucleotidyltransferase [Rectinema sp.]